MHAHYIGLHSLQIESHIDKEIHLDAYISFKQNIDCNVRVQLVGLSLARRGAQVTLSHSVPLALTFFLHMCTTQNPLTSMRHVVT